MKGLMGKPPQYLSTRPEGWQEKEQARLARVAATARKRAALQAEIDAMEYRCGGLTEAQRRVVRQQQRERALSRRRPSL